MIAAATRFAATSRSNRTCRHMEVRRRVCLRDLPQRDCLQRLRLAALADTTRFLNARLGGQSR